MDTIITNARIYVSRGEFAPAMLIRDGRIVRLGASADIVASGQEGAEVIDAAGATVVPGFNDAHLHLLNYSRYYVKARLDGCRSIADIVTTCRRFMAENPELVVTGLSGRGWNETGYPEDRLPDRHDLDAVSTAVPVVLFRVDGHMCVTNTKALEMLGLLGQPRYEQGIFTEFDCDRPARLIADLDLETLRTVWKRALQEAAAAGLTSVQSNDINDFSGEQDIISMMAGVYAQHQGPIRYRLQCCFRDYDDFAATVDQGRYVMPYADDMFALGPLKLYKDGSLGARTASLYADYADQPGNRGEMVMTREEMDRYMAKADQHGLQVITHAIGDRAIKETADSYATVAHGTNPLRHGVNHCQITTPAIMAQLAATHIVIWYQPIFLEYDLHIADARVGKALAATSYAYRTALELGCTVSFSSDSPVESFNPFYNLHCAVNRQDLQDLPAAGFCPDQRLDMAQAIDAYTYGSACMEFAEGHKGRLQAGYDADLVICSQDPFSAPAASIKDIHPLLTMVGGRVVYRHS